MVHFYIPMNVRMWWVLNHWWMSTFNSNKLSLSLENFQNYSNSKINISCNDITNFLPISVLSAPGKIIESKIYEKMYYLEKHNILLSTWFSCQEKRRFPDNADFFSLIFFCFGWIHPPTPDEFASSKCEKTRTSRIVFLLLKFKILKNGCLNVTTDFTPIFKNQLWLSLCNASQIYVQKYFCNWNNR